MVISEHAAIFRPQLRDSPMLARCTRSTGNRNMKVLMVQNSAEDMKEPEYSIVLAVPSLYRSVLQIQEGE